MSTTIQIKSHDGLEFDALYARAADSKAPAIVLVQEIFGINHAMKEAARRWAELGFHVVCPDLFWRQQRNVVLESQTPGHFDQAVALMQGMDPELALADIGSVCDWLEAALGHDRIAVLGYCLGGRLSIQAALRHPLRCAVSYYGVNLQDVLPAATPATPPALLHIAALDHFVPPPVRAQILEQVARLPQFEAHVYEGCDHAFARQDGDGFVAEAAALAERRSLDFMVRHTA
ncbi:dienelactone hydrolase family protein [Candidimonas nitroreducens]|uniref:Carboxymethylenebutenolidase n=1 Tax=Candidimonas nitroreducens TaxID=683354 RepID=A0A225M055_9BURK|nr:dienelactone hydrolase family protein [Candidimonas nitroreducens]OWT54764.1 carboxymethylenebutenolidase [Candidimonas nitroreducens]